MKIKAEDLKSTLSKMSGSGGSSINSEIIFMHRDMNSGTLVLGISDRSSYIRYNSQIVIPDGDTFYLDSTISFNTKVLTDIIGSFGNTEIDISKTENSIVLKSPKEVYELTFNKPSQQITDLIFSSTFDDDTKILVSNIPSKDLKPIGLLISNLGACKVDNKVRTIIHRKSNVLTSVFITNTTLNTFQATLEQSPEYNDTDIGIDTKSTSIPEILSMTLKSFDSDQKVTIKYSSKKLYIETYESHMCTTYEASKESSNIEMSIKSYVNMKDIIEKANTNTLKILVPGMDLERELNKATLLLPKVIASRLDSHIPLEITSNSSMRIKFSTSNGAYENSLNALVSIEGFIEQDESNTNKFQTFNMNVPIMRGVLNTITKCFPKDRVEILMKDTLDNKTYIQIKPEKSESLKYYLRLRR